MMNVGRSTGQIKKVNGVNNQRITDAVNIRNQMGEWQGKIERKGTKAPV